MVDTISNKIFVLSYEGKIIRSWGKFGNKPGNLKNPTGIKIFRKVLFVLDSGNYRIQAFTRYGKFLFEHKYSNKINATKITITNNYVYINSRDQPQILKFKLVYGKNSTDKILE